MNKVILEGRLTQDAVVKEVGAGKVAHITLALNRTWRDKQGQDKKESTFVKCVLWNQGAQQVEGLKKGSKLYVEGRLKQEKWIDKVTQKERSELVVMVAVAKPGQAMIGSSIQEVYQAGMDSYSNQDSNSRPMPIVLNDKWIDNLKPIPRPVTPIFEKDSELLNSAELDDLPF